MVCREREREREFRTRVPGNPHDQFWVRNAEDVCCNGTAPTVSSCKHEDVGNTLLRLIQHTVPGNPSSGARSRAFPGSAAGTQGRPAQFCGRICPGADPCRSPGRTSPPTRSPAYTHPPVWPAVTWLWSTSITTDSNGRKGMAALTLGSVPDTGVADSSACHSPLPVSWSPERRGVSSSLINVSTPQPTEVASLMSSQHPLWSSHCLLKVTILKSQA